MTPSNIYLFQFDNGGPVVNEAGELVGITSLVLGCDQVNQSISIANEVIANAR